MVRAFLFIVCAFMLVTLTWLVHIKIEEITSFAAFRDKCDAAGGETLRDFHNYMMGTCIKDTGDPANPIILFSQID